MEIIKTAIEGPLIIKPDVYKDPRGYFFESYNQLRFFEMGLDCLFMQDNESLSKKNVLRGLHFQKPPHSQGKLVRVVHGAVLDVAVDIRKDSKTFGKYVSTVLSGENKIMFWIPTGFAHGFLTLEDDTVFSYKCTEVYHKDSEVCIRWDDPDLNIDWVIKDPLVSEKDQMGISFAEVQSK